MKPFVLLALGALVQACGGGHQETASAPPPAVPSAPAPAPAEPPAICSLTDQRESLAAYMQQQYFWYAQLATPDANAASMDAWFQSALFKPTDRFSYSQPTAAFDQVFRDGRRTGYGYTLVWADAAHTRLRVRNVEPLSPVARAGLQRGDTVLSVDGYSPQQIAAGQVPAVTTTGVARVFEVENVQGQRRTLAVDSEDFALSPVAATAVLDATRNGVPVKVAYLAYHQFAGYSLFELADAIFRFGQAGARELVLDLRYNGGGSVAVSRDLASMVGGERTAGRVFTTLRYNDRQSWKNADIRFSAPDAPFAPLTGLDRVFVIASGGTASASELIVNGLRPFMPVILVGETTYGKPYGFAPRSYCGTTYSAVNFESVNALGAGGYTAGFAPDCAVPDDLDRQLGDPAEGRTRAVLNYVATGSCGAATSSKLAAPRAGGASTVFGETLPNQMFVE